LRVTINEHGLGRYFDRPEVRQACKYQQLIQTPEFTQLPEDAIVGGRFRPRGSQEVRMHCDTKSQVLMALFDCIVTVRKPWTRPT
jgi:hypothetical protein